MGSSKRAALLQEGQSDLSGEQKRVNEQSKKWCKRQVQPDRAWGAWRERARRAKQQHEKAKEHSNRRGERGRATVKGKCTQDVRTSTCTG